MNLTKNLSPFTVESTCNLWWLIFNVNSLQIRITWVTPTWRIVMIYLIDVGRPTPGVGDTFLWQPRLQGAWPKEDHWCFACLAFPLISFIYAVSANEDSLGDSRASITKLPFSTNDQHFSRNFPGLGPWAETAKTSDMRAEPLWVYHPLHYRTSTVRITQVLALPSLGQNNYGVLSLSMVR